jgi:hypothetical protein
MTKEEEDLKMKFHAFYIWKNMQVLSFILWLLLLPGSLQHPYYVAQSGFRIDARWGTNQEDKMYSSAITICQMCSLKF